MAEWSKAMVCKTIQSLVQIQLWSQNEINMYKFSIKVPIYNCICHIIIDKDIEKIINRYIKKKKWDSDEIIPEGEEVHGWAHTEGDVTNYYIFYSIDSLTVTYLSHEISHMIDYIIEEKGIENKGEARAYLTGFVSEKIFDYVLKKGLLINKWYKPNKKEDEKPSELLRESNENIQG